MKTLICCLGFLLACTGIYAQSDSIHIWNKWCVRRDTLLLFDKGYNVIEVYCPAVKPGDLKLKSLDKTLRIGDPEIKGDTLLMLAMPYPQKGKNMRLAIQHKKTGKTMKTVEFTSAGIPELVAHVGKIRSGEASRKDILAQNIMTIEFPGSLYNYPYHIKQYTFKILSPKGGATINVNGIFIPTSIKQAIKDAPEGTVADFTNVRVTCPDCVTRTLPDVKLKIR